MVRTFINKQNLPTLSLHCLHFQPGDEALDEMHGHGEFELPEYFQYGDSLESQVKVFIQCNVETNVRPFQAP